jgi:hypothetical protein
MGWRVRRWRVRWRGLAVGGTAIKGPSTFVDNCFGPYNTGKIDGRLWAPYDGAPLLEVGPRLHLQSCHRVLYEFQHQLRSLSMITDQDARNTNVVLP